MSVAVIVAVIAITFIVIIIIVVIIIIILNSSTSEQSVNNNSNGFPMLPFPQEPINILTVPIIPKAPDKSKFGLPGIDYCYHEIDTHGKYYLYALNENGDPLTANVNDQNNRSFSPWQIINKLPSNYKITLSYLYNKDGQTLPFFSVNGGKDVNWVNAQPGKALPIYPNMRLKIEIENNIGILTAWLGSSSWDDITIFLKNDGTCLMFTNYGNLKPI